MPCEVSHGLLLVLLLKLFSRRLPSELIKLLLFEPAFGARQLLFELGLKLDKLSETFKKVDSYAFKVFVGKLLQLSTILGIDFLLAVH